MVPHSWSTVREKAIPKLLFEIASAAQIAFELGIVPQFVMLLEFITCNGADGGALGEVKCSTRRAPTQSGMNQRSNSAVSILEYHQP